MSLQKLVDLVNKLRIVKHGDTILADDHNSLVDVSKSIVDYFLPSGIMPMGGVQINRLFDNFFSPNIGSSLYFNIEANISYNTNVCDFSIARNCRLVTNYVYELAEYKFIPAFSYCFESLLSSNPTIYPCRFHSAFRILNVDFTGNIFYPALSVDIFINNKRYTSYMGVLIGKNYSGFVVIDESNLNPPEGSPEIDVFDNVYSFFKEVDKNKLKDWYILYLAISAPDFVYIEVYDRNYKPLFVYRVSGESIESSPTICVSSCFDVWSFLRRKGLKRIPYAGICEYDWLVVDYSVWGHAVL